VNLGNLKFVQLKGQVLFKGHFKIFFLRTLQPRKAEFYMKAFLQRTKASWLKSMAPQGRIGQKEMKCIFCIGEIFLYGSRFLTTIWPMGLFSLVWRVVTIADEVL
jgi:hypothetical protein